SPKLWTQKTRCLFFTLLVRPEIQKVWCIPPPDTWFLRLILSKMFSVTKKMMSIGVRQILAGLPDIHTLFMARYSTEQQRFCLKEFPIILMPGVFGKPS